MQLCPKASCCRSWGNHQGWSPAVRGPLARSLPEKGAWERTASPAFGREEALRRLGSSRRRGSAGRKKPLRSFAAAAAPRATWPPGGRACAPAPSPGGRRASDSGGGDGAERETRRRGEGRRLHLAPVRRPGRGRAGLDPRQPRRSGGGGEPPASPGGGPGNLSHPRSGDGGGGGYGDACGGRPARRPLPEPRWAGSPGRSRSPAAGNSRSSPSSRRSAPPGLPRLPEGEPHAGRPSEGASDRAARPRPHPVPLGEAATSPGPPLLPAPRGRRNAWQPRPGAILSGRGAARPRCFRLFPGPRPASRGPRLPAEEGHVEGEGRAASIRLGAGEGPGDTRPDSLARPVERQNC